MPPKRRASRSKLPNPDEPKSTALATRPITIVTPFRSQPTMIGPPTVASSLSEALVERLRRNPSVADHVAETGAAILRDHGPAAFKTYSTEVRLAHQADARARAARLLAARKGAMQFSAALIGVGFVVGGASEVGVLVLGAAFWLIASPYIRELIARRRSEEE